MTPERWREVRELLGQALETDRDERDGFLAVATENDPLLREEVDALLAVEEHAEADLPTVNAWNRFDGLASIDWNLKSGQRLGPYEIVDVIGKGGMATVYRAVRADGQFEKQVAIKVIHSSGESPYFIARFKSERQILARLEHPNIARILDSGTTDTGLPFLVMEMIEGIRINEYCDLHSLTTRDRIALFLQLCDAVQYAHQNLIVHRDIKPSNVLVGIDGLPKLLDFGIAKPLAPEEEGENIKTLFPALTPAYASPEQVKGEPLTTASDVYSLGVVLYELLTGHSPYRTISGSSFDLIQSVCEDIPERPSKTITRKIVQSEPGAGEITADRVSSVRDGSIKKLQRALHGDLDNIVLMALSKEPERRYSSVEQLAGDLRRFLKNLPVVASRGSFWYRTAKFTSRHKASLTIATVAVLLVFATLLIALRQAHIAQQQRRLAEQRFADVRKLANSLVFEVHDSIADLPGSTPARKLIMDRALEYLDSLAKSSAGNADLQRELAFAYQRLGRVQGDLSQGNLGQTDAMVASDQKAAALFEEVGRANPKSTIDQLNVAFAHRLLGVVSSQFSIQRQQIERALSITGHLREADPANLKVKSERAIELSILAGLEDDDGDAQGSYEALRQSCALEEDQVGSHYPRATHDLALMRVKAADELALLGDRKAALALNASGISLYDSIVNKDKNNARAARELAVSISKRGAIQMADGEFPAALASYRRALAIAEPLQRVDPENFSLKVDLGGHTESVGNALVSTGNLRQGLSMIMSGIRLLEPEMKADPSNALPAAAAGYVLRADALVKTGNLIEAVESSRKAISLLESSLGTDPDLATLAQLAATYVELGYLLEKEGAHKQAELAYRKAVQVAEPLETGRTSNIRASYALADAYFRLGDALRKAAEKNVSGPAETHAQWSEAREWFAKSVAEWRKIPHPGVRNPFGFSVSQPADAGHGLSQAALHTRDE